MIEVATIWVLLKTPIAAPIRMEVRIPTAKMIKNYNAAKPVYSPARHITPAPAILSKNT